MKKTGKLTGKLLALFLTIVLACSLSACSGNSTTQEAPASDFEYEATGSGIKITAYTGSATKIKIPALIENKKVTSLATNVFAGNVIIESIVLPEYIKVIDLRCFNGCDSLKRLEALAETIDCKGTRLSSITELVLPNVTCITYGNSDVSWFEKLEKLIAPNCVQIASSSVPSSIKEITMKDTPQYVKIGTETERDYNAYGEEIIKEKYRFACEIASQADLTEETASYVETTYKYEKMTDENRSKYICSVIDTDRITINGVVYESTERYEEFVDFTK